MTHISHRHKRLLTGILGLGGVSFFMSLAQASFSTIWAIYLKSFFHNDALVGTVAAVFALFSFILFFFIIPILEKHSKHKMLFYSMILMIICFVFYYFIDKVWMLFAVTFFLLIAAAFRRSSFGILIRDASKLKDIGKNESIIYTIFNFSWIIAPFIAALFLKYYGVNHVFLLCSGYIVLSLIVLSKVKIKEPVHKGEFDTNALKNFHDFLSDKDKIKAYFISAGMGIWWSIVYIYLPLMILRAGLGPEWIGYSLFAIPVPLICLEWYAGRRADKEGFRKFFLIGFIFLAVISLLIFFADSIFLIMALFVGASFGAALIEPLRDGYFFKITPKTKADKYYPPFLTSSDIGGTVGKLIAAGAIVFLGFKYIFLFLFFEMLFFAYVSFTIKEKN